MANLGLLLLLQMALMVMMPTMAVVPMEEEQYYSVLNNKNMPTSSSSSSSRALDDSRSNKKYAVIFDAGSSGSRVHVFCFNRINLGLVPVGNGTDLTLFSQTKPGLSAYANDPQAAAESLFPLLEKGESVVPKEFRPQTPLIVGATAGLRLLEGDKAEKILQAVRSLLASRSTLQFETKRVSILDGDQEGSYQWMTVNYLLGNLGKKYAETVGVVDLGGGSVQMAYAISNKSAANAPPSSSDGEDYVNKKILNGTEYYLYVHSYLNYGLLASRAQILSVSKNSSNPCILAGYNGFYTYGGVAYKASALASGSSVERCRTVILEALKVDEICKYKKCTFGGIWNGGGGSGQKNLYIASYFFDKAAQAGFIDASSPVAKVTPAHFKRAAAVACSSNYKDANSTFPDYYRPDLPYVCLDMTYLYSLLVHGFGIPPRKEITLVKQVQYHDSLLEAAWPLGNAIEAVSSLA